MSSLNDETVPPSSRHDLSSVVIPLLKGALYQDNSPDVWNALLDLQAQVRDYVSVLGLELALDESEGYAFLRSSSDEEDEGGAKRPRLVARRPLTYHDSLLLALLRKKLAEFDARGEDTRLVVSLDEVVEILRIFLPESTNQTRLVDQVATSLGRASTLGFVRELHGQKQVYEVRRILKAFVDAQWLADFDLRLAEYRTHAAASESGAGDE